MNSNNVLSISGVLLLGIIVVVTTLGIGGQMAKAGLVIDNSVAGFAGQSKNIQRTVIVNTPTPTTTPNPISTIQGNLSAAGVASSTPTTI